MYKHVYMYFMHTQIHVYMQSHVDKDTHTPCWCGAGIIRAIL